MHCHLCLKEIVFFKQERASISQKKKCFFEKKNLSVLIGWKYFTQITREVLSYFSRKNCPGMSWGERGQPYYSSSAYLVEFSGQFITS